MRGLRRSVALGITVPVAESRLSRLLGLALLERERAGTGLLIPRCRSVHTFGMRFPIDVHFLDGGGRPLRAVSGLGRCRVVAEPAAAAVLELPSPIQREVPERGQFDAR